MFRVGEVNLPTPLDTGLRRYDGYSKTSFRGNDGIGVFALTLALSRERERGLDSRFRGNDGGL